MKSVVFQMVKIGIIGGSGLEDPELLKEKVEKQVDTPYGKVTCSVLFID